MSVLVIRAHHRFAMREQVSCTFGDGNTREGVLIELSREGCRISQLGEIDAAEGSIAEIGLSNGNTLPAKIRWTRDSTIGLRFEQPMSTAELTSIVEAARNEVSVSRYGPETGRDAA